MDKDKFSSKFNTYFVMLVILAMVVLVESVMIINSLKGTTKTTSSITKNAILPIAKTGTMGITLIQGQKVTVGKKLQAQLVFDSVGEKLAGIDAILTFDPKLISLAEIKPDQELFEQNIVNQQQKDKGRIKITAYQPKKSVLGKLNLASISFTLLKNQPAVFGIEFLGPDRVTDSNLVSLATQKDILSSIQPLKLTPEI